jgi:hypothetical protein
LENAAVTMKVTLSYFIEPNLTGRAATRPDTYRSFGLRFAIKKRTETAADFRRRLSNAPGERTENDGEADYWLLGPQAMQRRPAWPISAITIVWATPTRRLQERHRGRSAKTGRSRCRSQDRCVQTMARPWSALPLRAKGWSMGHALLRQRRFAPVS